MGLLVRTNSHPSLNVNDTLVSVFRDHIPLSVLYVTSETPNTVVEVRSATSLGTIPTPPTTTLTFVASGETQRIDLPATGGTLDKVTTVKVTNGRAAAAVVAIGEINTYLQQ